MHKDVSSMPVLTDTYPNVPCRSIQFTSEGILHLLLDLKPNKPPGPDRIPAHLLKEQAYELVVVLALLYKADMEQECLPTKWKNANVVPIFKNDWSYLLNYPSVSPTSICCKFLKHYLF